MERLFYFLLQLKQDYASRLEAAKKNGRVFARPIFSRNVVERGDILAFQVFVILAGLAVGWIRKGSLWAVTNIRLRAIWLLPISYILQHVSIDYLTGITYEVTIVFSYVSLLIFCLQNIRVPGLLWAFGGTAANFLAMLSNGLRMPAYLPAVQHMAPTMIPRLMRGEYGKSIAMTAHTHFNFLGDIFSFEIKPASLISVGDILFAIGLVILIQYGMRMGKGGTVGGVQAETA